MKTWHSDRSLELESGGVLENLQIAYSTYGTLNEQKDNVIWVCHALTANSEVHDWWPGMVGAGLPFDTDRYFLICANVIGGCYGSTGPLSKDKRSGEAHYHDFPELTIRDMVNAHKLLAEHIGIDSIALLIGASLGGQQALEWAIDQADRIQNLVLIACNAKHSPWGIAFNESQRMAIEADRTWQTREDKAGLDGMRAARSMALLSYRNYDAYAQTQSDYDGRHKDFSASSYQRYQGEKLSKRFNAFSYYRLSSAMDSHDVGRGRGGIRSALSKVHARTMVIGISSDILFPPSEQGLLADYIHEAGLHTIDSDFGHDGFLVETEPISRLIRSFQLEAEEQDLGKII